MLAKYELGYTCRSDEYETTYRITLVHAPDDDGNILYNVRYKSDSGKEDDALASEYFISQCMPIT